MQPRFVDCRPRDAYLAGHVPGAAHADPERDLTGDDGGGRHPLPRAEAFATWAARAGIGPDTLVVAYDDDTGWAARLWWLLRHFGHEDVAVLRGGLDDWLGPLRAGEEGVEPADFHPRPREGDVVSAEEIQERLGKPDFLLVDARAAERYRGEVEPIDPVAGHIPGAVNMPFTEEPTPVDPDAEVVVYCGSGLTAAVTILALERAGVEARLYPGSWSEWSSRGLEVERG